TDAAILAAAADGVLVVSRYGHTKREQLSHAVDNLADVDASVLGVVFTLTPTRGGASYAYNYRYYGESTQNSRSSKSSRPTTRDAATGGSSTPPPDVRQAGTSS